MKIVSALAAAVELCSKYRAANASR
eukprot:COSAG01_NODE_34167_length_551_cov_0.713024_1_plen_24_part_10